MFGILIGIALILFLVFDWLNNFTILRAVFGLSQRTAWPLAARIIRLILGVVVAVTLLFLASTIGIITNEPWLVVIPTAIAGLLVIFLLGFGTLAVQIGRWTARWFNWLTGSQMIPLAISGDKSWQRSIVSALFWLYILLAIYPTYNPWTGDINVIWYVLMYATAAALLGRWLGLGGYIGKILAFVLVPVLFCYTLGKAQPDEHPNLNSRARAVDAAIGLNTAERNLNTAVKGQRTKFSQVGAIALEQSLRGTIKFGKKALDSSTNSISRVEKGEVVEIQQELKLNDPSLSVSYKTLKDYFGANKVIYEVLFPDDNGYYSSKSIRGYVPAGDIEGIIDIPKPPDINDPREEKKRGFKRISSIPSGMSMYTEKAEIKKGFSWYINWASVRKGERVKVVSLRAESELIWYLLDNPKTQQASFLEGPYPLNEEKVIQSDGWLYVQTWNATTVSRDTPFTVFVNGAVY